MTLRRRVPPLGSDRGPGPLTSCLLFALATIIIGKGPRVLQDVYEGNILPPYFIDEKIEASRD